MSALTDEQFEHNVRELLMIARFYGEATDPSVLTVIEEARNGRAALDALGQLVNGLGTWANAPVDAKSAWFAAVEVLRKAGRR